LVVFFFSSRRRHTRFSRDWSSDVCSSDLSNMVEFTEKLNNNKGTLGKLLNDSIMAENVEQSILNIRRGSDDLEVTIQRINNSWLLNLFSKKDKENKSAGETLR